MHGSGNRHVRSLPSDSRSNHTVAIFSISASRATLSSRAMSAG
jgi:hypothetical protein